MMKSEHSPHFPLANTYSIIARDPETGQLGGAVQSHWFSVGSLVIWAEPGVGVVATQALVEVSYGPLGLSLLRAGKSPEEALKALTSVDSGQDMRQVAMVDALGRSAAHTGAHCMADAGHITGDGFSVQANMMSNPSVWGAMAEAYQGAKGDIAERLVSALEAAQAAGGDIRGQQSACIYIVKPQSTGAVPASQPWQNVVMDLRIEDHPKPIQEMRRLVRVQRAYDLMNLSDVHMGKGETELALQAYSKARQIAPEMDEIAFWHAVTLADLGKMDEAMPAFKEVFAVNADWARLLQRLAPAGMIHLDEASLQRILSQCLPA
jgi:uncharacterized Ntn-hydrolase superfamily protein